jgi:prepilin-type N-terminal cleavage/methylation domain-containing protein
MTQFRRQNHGGFTLVEIIVVLAVISALLAIISPRVFPYIDDAQKTQSQADVRQISAAIQTMYKDTGRWPFYKDGRGPLPYASGTDAAILTSNPLCHGGALNTCDANTPEDRTSGGTWALATAIADSLTNQIIRNRPFDMAAGAEAYRMTGNRPWKGPYLNRMVDTDPWGKSYLVNIANADPADEGAETQNWVLVVSAGPNGALETSAVALGTADPTPGGDDIVARVK